MMKRVVALILCFLMLATALIGCQKKDEDDKGAYINMYLSDMVYDFDPAHAYINESNLRIVSLLFDNLFILNEKGKVEKSLAKSYEIVENEQLEEYKMLIELNDTCWTDGIGISANDVVFAWKRALEPEASYEVASLLFDVKNARLVKEGDATIDDLGVYALNEKTVEIVFEGKIDYDHFLLNLTSYALAPLREEIVTKTEDWAKKPATMVSSGPFRLRTVSYEPETAKLVLERNMYYYRSVSKDALDKSVTPYRIIVDYTMTDEQIMQAYKNGQLFFVGDIPVSYRSEYLDEAVVKEAMSTHTYVLNHDAVVRYYDAKDFEDLSGKRPVVKADSTLQEGVDGDKIFAKTEVRKAMSLAIDRDAIAKSVVLASAATGLVPTGVFEARSAKETFRDKAENLIVTSAKVDEAKAMLASAGIDAGKYMFAISVAAYDDVHMMIAEAVKTSWEALGFHVAINPIEVITNDDKLITTDEVAQDIKDDLFEEAYRAGRFEVMAIDYTAFSVDAYSVLARLATRFSGQGMDMTSTLDYVVEPHLSGYNSEAFNAKMEEVYAQKDIDARAALLHEAEKIAVDEMAVIPIIFNQTATLLHDDLSKVDYSYQGYVQFKKAKLKDYLRFTPVEEE